VASPETVATDLHFPEGPVWVPATSVGAARLVCTSVADGAIVEIDLDAGTYAPVAVFGGGANAALLADDGGFLITQNGGIDFAAAGLPGAPPYRPVRPGIQRVDAAGAISYVAPLAGAPDDTFRAPNDLVCAADGTLWFTDPPHFPPPAEPMGRVHTMTPDGATTVVAEGLHYPNGIALEPDGTPVIVEANGLLRLRPDGTREWVTERLGTATGDGFCLDVDGRFYVANTSEHGVRILEPDGREVEFLAIPGDGITTNCCFGGADGRTLFATDGLPGTVVAWEGMPTAGLALTPWPVPRS
jgi:sugar lactone lactonase YvrE